MSQSERNPTSKNVLRSREAADRGFERWVEQQLHQLYDDVLQEDIPEHLLDLVTTRDADLSEVSTTDNQMKSQTPANHKRVKDRNG